MKDVYEMADQIETLRSKFSEHSYEAKQNLTESIAAYKELDQMFSQYLADVEQRELERKKPMTVEEPELHEPGQKTPAMQWKAQDFEKLFIEARSKLNQINRMVQGIRDFADEGEITTVTQKLLKKIEELTSVDLK